MPPDRVTKASLLDHTEKASRLFNACAEEDKLACERREDSYEEVSNQPPSPAALHYYVRCSDPRQPGQ